MVDFHPHFKFCEEKIFRRGDRNNLHLLLKFLSFSVNDHRYSTFSMAKLLICISYKETWRLIKFGQSIFRQNMFGLFFTKFQTFLENFRTKKTLATFYMANCNLSHLTTVHALFGLWYENQKIFKGILIGNFYSLNDDDNVHNFKCFQNHPTIVLEQDIPFANSERLCCDFIWCKKPGWQNFEPHTFSDAKIVGRTKLSKNICRNRWRIM